MSVERIRQGVAGVVGGNGKVDQNKLDALVLGARDGGGIDAAERAELILASNSFDDAGKQRLLTHLSVAGQKAGFVNVELRSQLRETKGRYAVMATNVKGITVKVGLFDNTFAVSGRPSANGKLQLTIEGKEISVDVKKGESPVAILERIKAKLPSSVTGLTLGGDARLFEMESYKGEAAKKSDQAAHLVLYKPEALGLKAGEKPLRVVVTGYGKFMGIEDNPSANMAQRLAEAGVPGAIVEYRRLDVTLGAVDRFMEEMRRNPPDVILSMGVTPGSSQVEERPENHVGAAEDGEGKPIVDGEVRPGAAKELKTDLPVAVIDGALQKFGDKREVGTSLSDPSYQPDRSAYLCNYIGFNLASAFGGEDTTTAGFVHVTDHTPTDQMQTLLEAVVARQLDFRREGPPRV